MGHALSHKGSPMTGDLSIASSSTEMEEEPPLLQKHPFACFGHRIFSGKNHSVPMTNVLHRMNHDSLVGASKPAAIPRGKRA